MTDPVCRTFLVAGLLVFAACSGAENGAATTQSTAEEPATSSVETSTTTTGPAPSTTAESGTTEPVGSQVITSPIRGYFEAFAKNDPGREAMLDYALPGSAAHDYATYWWHLFQAAGPERGYHQLIDFDEALEVSACIPSDEESPFDSGCITYTDFAVDSSTGLLVDFEEAGRPMSETVALGDGTTASADGVTIEVVVAKQVTRDRIAVVWELSNTNDTATEGQVRLMSASGDIVQVDAWTQNAVPPGDSILNAANIAVDQLGGTLQYRITATESVLEVAVPSP